MEVNVVIEILSWVLLTPQVLQMEHCGLEEVIFCNPFWSGRVFTCHYMSDNDVNLFTRARITKLGHLFIMVGDTGGQQMIWYLFFDVDLWVVKDMLRSWKTGLPEVIASLVDSFWDKGLWSIDNNGSVMFNWWYVFMHLVLLYKLE